MAQVGACVNTCASSCWLTTGNRNRQPNLAPVPGVRAKPVADQLAAALKATKVSQKELSRRLAAIDGSAPETARRWIGKVLHPNPKDGVYHPEQWKMNQVAEALGVPHTYFKIPARPKQVDRASAALDFEARLAALEAQAVRTEDMPTIQRPLLQGIEGAREAIRALANGDTAAALRALSDMEGR